MKNKIYTGTLRTSLRYFRTSYTCEKFCNILEIENLNNMLQSVLKTLRKCQGFWPRPCLGLDRQQSYELPLFFCNYLPCRNVFFSVPFFSAFFYTPPFILAFQFEYFLREFSPQLFGLWRRVEATRLATTRASQRVQTQLKRQLVFGVWTSRTW